MKMCTSCGKQSKEHTKFKCPECGNEIYRCKHCKHMSIEYKCSCGFTGP